MLTRPRDREVVCHASAWDMDLRRRRAHQDVHAADRGGSLHDPPRARPRLLLPRLRQAADPVPGGANDGFHEAIGDTVDLSVTPAYLQADRPGRHGRSRAHEALINQQMKMALDKIAFLPFGKLIDQWRWKVFSGEIKPAELQPGLVGAAPQVPGRRAAGARAREEDFDPGAKYHIPANTPYTRYFLVVHPAVPVPQGAVRGGRLQGPAVRVLDLRQQAKPAAVTARCSRSGASQPWQRHAREAHRHAPDGRLRDHRVLRTAPGLG